MSKQSFSQTLALINSDMQFRCDYEHKKLTVLRAFGFLLNHAVMALVLYRLQVFFFTHHLVWMASFIQSLSSVIFTVSIDSRTQIAPGFLLLHASYINIGRNVTIGENCILAHQNSIGPAYIIENEDMTSDQGPTIGQRVFFGVGSVVFGNISIGDDSKIAANSAVDKSFPAQSILVGVPARNRAML